MKRLLKLLPVVMMASVATAQDEPVTPISEKQKEEFVQILKTLQESHNNRKNMLIKAGIAAITPAANNENAAMDLFERCYKTVEYDQNERRDPKDWRKWRTDNKDGFTNAANKRALRYQARWALITLQAAMEPEETFDASKYAPQAIALLGEIIRDDKYVLLASKSPFNGSVITNQIGRLYELNACRPKGGWPDNILDMNRVMEGVVLAPARQKADVPALRKGWSNLIALQKARNDIEAKAPSSITNPTSGQGDRRGGDRMDRRRMMMMGGFNPNDIEDMAWRCEIDCYRCGDEYNASNNMINLIRNTKDARKQEQRINMMVALLESNQQQQNRRNQMGLEGGGYGNGMAAQRPNNASAPAGSNTASQPSAPAAGAPAPAPHVPAPAAAPARPAGPPKPMVEEV